MLYFIPCSYPVCLHCCTVSYSLELARLVLRLQIKVYRFPWDLLCFGITWRHNICCYLDNCKICLISLMWKDFIEKGTRIPNSRSVKMTPSSHLATLWGILIRLFFLWAPPAVKCCPNCCDSHSIFKKKKNRLSCRPFRFFCFALNHRRSLPTSC